MPTPESPEYTEEDHLADEAKAEAVLAARAAAVPPTPADALAIDLAAVPLFERMQRVGMLLDCPALHRFADTLQADMWRFEDRLRIIAGRYINPGPSSKTLERYLLDDLMLVPPHYTDKGNPQINDAWLTGLQTNLRPLATRSPRQETILEVATLVTDYRERQKLRSTYALPLPRMVDADSRIHPKWRLTRVVTGRPASHQPNLLNIPVATELGKRIRAAFVAYLGTTDRGRRLAAWDLSNIEMRVMAHVAQDDAMRQIFIDGGDIHTLTAARIFDKRPEDIDRTTERYPCKRMGFLIIYGGEAQRLSEELRLAGLDWPEDKCHELIREYIDRVYPGVGRQMTHCAEEGRRKGYVSDMWGRRRLLPGLRSEIRRVRAEAERMAINFPIQAGAQGLMKRAMATAWQHIQARPDVEPLLQVYDELVLELPDGAYAEVDAWMRDCLENTVTLSVPVVSTGAVGCSWAELEK